MWGVIQRLTYDVGTERGKQAASNLQKCLIWSGHLAGRFLLVRFRRTDWSPFKGTDMSHKYSAGCSWFCHYCAAVLFAQF